MHREPKFVNGNIYKVCICILHELFKGRLLSLIDNTVGDFVINIVLFIKPHINKRPCVNVRFLLITNLVENTEQDFVKNKYYLEIYIFTLYTVNL